MMDASTSGVKSLQEADLDWDINCCFSEYYTLLFTANRISLFTLVLSPQSPLFFLVS